MAENGILKNIFAGSGGGIIGGLGSVIGSVINSRQNNKNIKAQNEANLMLSKTQNDFNTEMWNKQNQYNSPQAQMERFKDAGLNPNLIYDRGTSGISTAAPVKQAPSIDATRTQPFNIGQVLSQYQEFAMNTLKNNNLREQGNILQNQVVLQALKTDYDSFGLADIQNMFQTKWGYEGPWNSKPGDITQSWQGQKMGSELLKTQMDALSAKQKKEMNDITLKYMHMGSPAWQAVIQALRLFRP